MNTTTKDREREIRDYAIERLKDMKGYDREASEVHNEIFNTDYYIIGRHRATEWLGDYVFMAIDKIKEYEQDNFGEVTTDLSEPERVVNMYVYIVGEEILQESKTLRDKWDDKLTDADIDDIISEIE